MSYIISYVLEAEVPERHWSGSMTLTNSDLWLQPLVLPKHNITKTSSTGHHGTPFFKEYIPDKRRLSIVSLFYLVMREHVLKLMQVTAIFCDFRKSSSRLMKS